MHITKDSLLHQNTRIAIAGLGTIGKAVAAALDQGIPGMRLVAVTPSRTIATMRWLEELKTPVAVAPAEQLAALADIVIECGSGELLLQIAEKVLMSGKKLVVLSASGLLALPHLSELAQRHRTQILVPSGALGGLDMISAMAQGQIHAVKLITRKPPDGLRSIPYLLEREIDVDQLHAPTCIFAGSARAAAQYFPVNLNVAATLALAGIGPDLTQVELWADPNASGNHHTVYVESDAGKMTISVEGLPSMNPKTSRIVAQSILALLRGMCAPLKLG